MPTLPSTLAPQPLNPYPKRWLLTGVGALALAGLYALLLVVARTPQLKCLPLFTKLFHETLVVHVDLSVLVWFLAIACMVWSMEAARRAPRLHVPYLEGTALSCFALGSLILALSPLDSRGEALMSNYIPVISNPVFFIGLMLIAVGVVLQLLFFFLHHGQTEGLLRYAAVTSAWITLIALAAFALTYPRIPAVIEGQQYYELLFWAGGHLLQFTHGQMVIFSWVMLALAIMSSSGLIRGPHASPGNEGDPRVKPEDDGFKRIKYLFAFGTAAAVAGLPPFFYYAVESQDFRQYYTWHMIALAGIAPAIIGIAATLKLLRAGRIPCEKRALKSTLAMSLILFFYGGFLGMMIHGQDVTIPAHYHGSIVGATLAFMGLTYLLLSGFGARDMAGTRLAFWQPIVYGGGQILHISGLAWSGGYGVLRKTPCLADGTVGEVTQQLAPDVKAALGLMGGGGAIAIVGGFMFVLVVWRAINKARHPRA